MFDQIVSESCLDGIGMKVKMVAIQRNIRFLQNNILILLEIQRNNEFIGFSKMKENIARQFLSLRVLSWTGYLIKILGKDLRAWWGFDQPTGN